ncbi:MAG: cache domain-containing protein, partial [Proteobacteria bacterium]|nr:cache domain-containing protein [Pseudomonadota bacterium]
MRLRNKLLGGILLVTLVPVLALGALFYTSYRRDLVRGVRDHLRSVAAIQQARLSAILLQNQERLALVSSRTQLRQSMDAYLSSADPMAPPRMARILEDAARSIPELETITVYSTGGVAVASTDSDQTGRPFLDLDLLSRSRIAPVVDHLLLDAQGEVRAYLCGPMILDGRTLGVVVIRAKVDNMLSSLFDYAGLGSTGETLLLEPTADGRRRSLTPTRFDPGAAMKTIPWDGELYAENGTEASAVDYRGARVLAVQRTVPGTNWLLVVKIDQKEALAGATRAGWRASALFALLVG